jgi:hypothetical protein
MFSTRPIIVWALGTKFIVDRSLFPRLIILNAPKEDMNPWFAQLRVASLTPVRVGQILEADTLIWRGSDYLFRRIREETINSNYSFPMMPRHADLRLKNFNDPRVGTPFDYPDHLRSMPYMHAHLSWGYNSLPFISRVYLESLVSKRFDSDEAALNVMLWERRATKQWCMYDPSPDRLIAYINNDSENYVLNHPGKTQLAYFFLHGMKAEEEQKEWILKLYEMDQKGHTPLFFCSKKWSKNISKECLAGDEFVPCIL